MFKITEAFGIYFAINFFAELDIRIVMLLHKSKSVVLSRRLVFCVFCIKGSENCILVGLRPFVFLFKLYQFGYKILNGEKWD